MRARTRASFLMAVALMASAAACTRAQNPEPTKPQHKLLLLTSLPLVFGEQFSLEAKGSPVLTALRQRYDVVPISVSSTPELAEGDLLLMAHPLPQTPENLVALDAWVRRGGRVLLLADPMLEWPSERPLGDPLRPPAMFMDTGLLKHWGIRLGAPGERGPQVREMAGREVLTSSPGSLSGSCDMSEDGLIAHCNVGKGRATIVADADILDVNHLEGPADHNVEALLAELASLAER